MYKVIALCVLSIACTVGLAMSYGGGQFQQQGYSSYGSGGGYGGGYAPSIGHGGGGGGDFFMIFILLILLGGNGFGGNKGCNDCHKK